MQIKLTGRGMEISVPIRDYVHEKIGKLEEHYKHMQKIEVILENRSNENVERRQVAEIRAWLSGLKMVQAVEAGRDVYAAFDMALDEAKRQIERHKEKQTDEQRRKGEKIKEELREQNYLGKSGEPTLVKVNRFASKPMSMEEAKEELRVMGQDFLAFYNTETAEINVLRRNTEGFDLLPSSDDMSPEDAVENLQKSGESLILFKNSSSRLPAIIFRRKSGNFGLIEPEL